MTARCYVATSFLMLNHPASFGSCSGSYSEKKKFPLRIRLPALEQLGKLKVAHKVHIILHHPSQPEIVEQGRDELHVLVGLCPQAEALVVPEVAHVAVCLVDGPWPRDNPSPEKTKQKKIRQNVKKFEKTKQYC